MPSECEFVHKRERERFLLTFLLQDEASAALRFDVPGIKTVWITVLSSDYFSLFSSWENMCLFSLQDLSLVAQPPLVSLPLSVQTS